MARSVARPAHGLARCIAVGPSQSLSEDTEIVHRGDAPARAVWVALGRGILIKPCFALAVRRKPLFTIAVSAHHIGSVTLVHQASHPQAATHVLIVGVGKYPALIGGTGALYADHGGMGQLTSPPLSVVRLAEWFVAKYDHPGRPLGSVELLASGASPVNFQHPDGGAAQAVDEPTFLAFDAAATAWKQRGDSHSDNLMIFYFCGHGIASSPEQALLMQDFGSEPAKALSSALDLRQFHLGMEQCRARQQAFFVDACRTGNPLLIGGYAGQALFTPSPHRDPSLPMRHKPVFYSTVEGSVSQARAGQVSLYTEALLEALEGGGADDTDGPWWVATNQLATSIQFIIQQAQIQHGYPLAQVNATDHLTNFHLHHLTSEPLVPVSIGCRPEALNSLATLSWSGNGGGATRGPDARDWSTTLKLGSYDFHAAGPPLSPNLGRYVRPPYRRVELRSP